MCSCWKLIEAPFRHVGWELHLGKEKKEEKFERAAGWHTTKQQELQYLQTAEGQTVNTPHPNLS